MTKPQTIINFFAKNVRYIILPFRVIKVKKYKSTKAQKYSSRNTVQHIRNVLAQITIYIRKELQQYIVYMSRKSLGVYKSIWIGFGRCIVCSSYGEHSLTLNDKYIDW